MRWHLLHNKYDEPEHVKRAELEKYLERLHWQLDHALDAYRMGDEKMKASCMPVLRRLRRSLIRVKVELASMEQEATG